MLGCRREDEAHLGEQASFLSCGRAALPKPDPEVIKPTYILESTFSRALLA